MRLLAVCSLSAFAFCATNVWPGAWSSAWACPALRRQAAACTQRRSFFLDPEPPAWYIEMEKWPYHTPAWKQWLADRKAGKPVDMPAE